MRLLWPDTRFEGGTTMLQRVALVLWWTSASIFLLCLAALGIAIVIGAHLEAFFSVMFALPAWAAGRAAFFILAGR